MSQKYGYIRVSTKKQNQARQIEEMKKHGIDEENIIPEKESGKSFERKKYKELKKRLAEGDILYFESIDRLGRTYDGIIHEWNYLIKRKKVKIKIISNPLLDTVDDNATLIVRFMKDIMLLISAYQAEQEFLNLKKRQEQGIAIAKKTGKKFGRPKKDIPQTTIEVIIKWREGLITSKEAMKALELKRSAFYNLIEKIEQRSDYE